MTNPVLRWFFALVLPAARVKGRLWNRWYRYLNRKVENEGLRFLNYGMALADDSALPLLPEDEKDRLSIQLYDRVASAVDLTGMRVLEVSCGRGGGAEYLARYRRPRCVVALDRTEAAVASCKRSGTAESVRFVCGDAMALPFADNAFDVVVNVEASHCYPRLEGFLGEVRRVLRPGGHFLYADFRHARRRQAWDDQLAASGMAVLATEEITPAVVESLNRAHEGRMSLIRRVAPRPLRSAFMAFAGTKGSVMHRAFERGRARYVRFVLQRPA